MIQYPVNRGKQKVIGGDLNKNWFHVLRLRHNGCDKAVEMVQAGIDQNIFSVSTIRITILMSRLRQTA